MWVTVVMVGEEVVDAKDGGRKGCGAVIRVESRVLIVREVSYLALKV